ncbi:putative protein phosphatase 1, regulatory (inhibitor) subunit 7 [Babesia divergens]|uniref:Protein phosphatase 1 regulatory subunit 7 n=1 Tax=Babesia divergens TaxID=32595 RepID=A0AAD9LJI3_BABDI|nr:putative protein phosphatase 1, regulatory (inhibitor) subunit 7 [Babesia divergens]
MTDDSCVLINRIGIDLEAHESSTVLEFHCSRIRRIENLGALTGLKGKLEYLDFYQNSISRIENLSHLTKLRVLDISFNEIKEIEGIDQLTNLRELYLASNRISKVENVSTLVNLELLELGSNQIRDYGEIHNLKELTALWIGRNKLTHMRVPRLPKLTKCSLQNNRIREWDVAIVENCPQLQELYLSFNRLTEIPAFVNEMANLSILDLGNNAISKILVKEANNSIEELWLNDNKVEDEQDIEPLRAFNSLRVLYLERNPIQAKLGPSYRNVILAMLPQLTQLDALTVVNRVT